MNLLNMKPDIYDYDKAQKMVTELMQTREDNDDWIYCLVAVGEDKAKIEVVEPDLTHVAWWNEG